MANTAMKVVVKKNKTVPVNSAVDPDADDVVDQAKQNDAAFKRLARGESRSEVIKVTLPKSFTDEVAQEQLEATREKVDVQVVYNKLIVLDKKMDALLSALNTVLAAQAKGFTVPTAPALKTYGADKRPAFKKEAEAPAEATEADSDPSGIQVGDFIIDEAEGWFKVTSVAGKGWYKTTHHQSGEDKSFRGTPQFLRRTKRKSTACWKLV